MLSTIGHAARSAVRQRICGPAVSAAASLRRQSASIAASATEFTGHGADAGMDAQRRLDSRIEDRLHRHRRGDHAMTPLGRDKARDTRLFSPIGDVQRELLRGLRRNLEALDWEGALSVLEQIPQQPGIEWAPVYRSILHVCCKAMQYEEAHRVWNQLPSRDVMSYNMMLGLYSRTQRWNELDDLLEQMDLNRVDKTAVTHSVVMNACSEAHRWEQAISILNDIKCTPEFEQTINWEIVYLSAMTACARAREQANVRTLFNELKARGAELQNHHYNALIVAAGSDGVAARAVFDEMRSAGLVPRLTDWRALLGCSRASFADLRGLYEEFRADMPDSPLEEVWAVLLRCAYSLEDVEAARWVLAEMRANGVDPNSEQAAATPSLRRALRGTWLRLSKARDQEDDTNASRPIPSTSSMPPLPAGWSLAVDPGTGLQYYWRNDDPARTTTWERPIAIGLN